jgi:hypothetical protein
MPTIKEAASEFLAKKRIAVRASLATPKVTVATLSIDGSVDGANADALASLGGSWEDAHVRDAWTRGQASRAEVGPWVRRN